MLKFSYSSHDFVLSIQFEEFSSFVISFAYLSFHFAIVHSSRKLAVDNGGWMVCSRSMVCNVKKKTALKGAWKPYVAKQMVHWEWPFLFFLLFLVKKKPPQTVYNAKNMFEMKCHRNIWCGFGAQYLVDWCMHQWDINWTRINKHIYHFVCWKPSVDWFIYLFGSCIFFSSGKKWIHCARNGEKMQSAKTNQLKFVIIRKAIISVIGQVELDDGC